MFDIISTLSVSLILAGLAFIFYPWVRENSRPARFITIVICHLVVLRYVYWRATETLPTFDFSDPIVYVAYLLFAVEAYMHWHWLKVLHTMVTPTNRSEEADKFADWYGKNYPMVDVLIPTYNESRDILETSLIGAMNIDYPRYRVWLLDDGNRDWLRELAADYGVHYLRRDNNAHFKAGNLNHAVKHLRGLHERPDFFAVFDADFVARAPFLKRTLALMHDRSVGIVQTPQCFYNPDPFQLAFREQQAWPEGQACGFLVQMPCDDVHERAYCIGSSFIIRDSSLQAIGDFPTQTVSEDLLTTMRLGKHGFRTRYLNEQLSAGLAPESLNEYLGQRRRWSLGFAELSRMDAEFASGSGFWARLSYKKGTLGYPIVCFLNLLLFLSPVIYWLTDFKTIDASAGALLAYMLPIWIKDIGTAWLYRSSLIPIVNEGAFFVTSIVIPAATFKGLLRLKPPTFKVTAKGLKNDGVVVYWGILVWVLFVLACSIGGIVYGLFSDYATLYPDRWALAYVWSFRGILALFVAALPCIELPKRRSAHRFETAENVRVRSGDSQFDAVLQNVSLGGAEITTQTRLGLGQRLELELELVGWVEAEVVRPTTATGYGTRLNLSAEQRQLLIKKVYCSDKYIMAPTFWSVRVCLKRVIERFFDWTPRLRSVTT